LANTTSLIRHETGAATGTKASMLTAESDQMFMLALGVTFPFKT
jgi:hypothetical protein